MYLVNTLQSKNTGESNVGYPLDPQKPSSYFFFPYEWFVMWQFLNALKTISHQDIIFLLEQCFQLGLDVIKTENLYTFDGKIGFSLAQGQ